MGKVFGGSKLVMKLMLAPMVSVGVLAVLAVSVYRGNGSLPFVLPGIGVAGFFILLVNSFMARKIILPIRQTVDAVKEITKGDLSIEVTSFAKDEIGDLTHAIEAMRLLMAEVVSQSVAASGKLSESTSGQSASLEETSSSLEEMTAMTRQNAGNATRANDLMQAAKEIIEKADGSMDQLIDSMNEIGKASEETQKIVKTIDEIAFQTNLLALNAAVEAARAGEAGAGFAVVAEEVRSLALRAAEAAKSTSGLMEDVVTKVQNGEKLVGRTNNAFREITDSSLNVVNLIGEIAGASQQQAHGIEQINMAVADMSNETQSNAARAEELATVMSMFTINTNASDDAKALALKAISFTEEKGIDLATKEFNNPNGRFSTGKSELYVVLQSMTGELVANPWQPQIVGSNDYDQKDTNGKYFVREMIDLVKTKGRGWIYYSWMNHQTGRPAPKKGWVQRVGNFDYYVLIPTLMT